VKIAKADWSEFFLRSFEKGRSQAGYSIVKPTCPSSVTKFGETIEASRNTECILFGTCADKRILVCYIRLLAHIKMKKLKSIFSAITLTILLVTTSCGVIKQSDKTANTKTETSIFPKPTGYVNDFENILNDAEEKELTALIKGLESQTSDQISIVTLTGLEPYDNIDDYSFDLANYWGVGQKDKNNGILIAIGKELRKIRIQNGFGIEKRLTDAETKRIIDEVMIPEFKNDKYFEGLKKGVEAIIQELK